LYVLEPQVLGDETIETEDKSRVAKDYQP